MEEKAKSAMIIVLIAVIMISLMALLYILPFIGPGQIIPPEMIIRCQENPTNYTMNITITKDTMLNPDIDWLDIEALGVVIANGTSAATSELFDEPDDERNYFSGNLISNQESLNDFVFIDMDNDSTLSTGDYFEIKGELAEKIKNSNDTIWLNLFYTQGNKHMLGRNYFYLNFTPFIDVD